MNKFIFTITNHCFLARIIKVPFYRLLWCLDMIISVTTGFHYFCSENICIIAQKIFIVFVLNLVSIKEMPSCMSHEKCYVKSECMFDALVKNFIYNIWVDPYGIFNVTPYIIINEFIQSKVNIIINVAVLSDNDSEQFTIKALVLHQYFVIGCGYSCVLLKIWLEMLCNKIL